MNRRSVRWAGGAVLGVVALLGLTKLVVEIRDRADPVAVSDVVDEFNAAAGASELEPAADFSTTVQDESGPEGLAVGVWAYDASGHEYIDLLGGPLHVFPDEVAQTVTDTECGLALEVTLFEQRTDVLELCEDGQGGLLLGTLTTRHEFVGVADVTITGDCGPLLIWWPSIGESDVGDSASADCVADGSNSGLLPARMTRTVVGIEDVPVAGEPVGTVRIRLTSEIATPDDATHGVYEAEMWVARDEGVIVKRTLDADVTAKIALGSVGLLEEFELVAQSLVPASGR